MRRWLVFDVSGYVHFLILSPVCMLDGDGEKTFLDRASLCIYGSVIPIHVFCHISVDILRGFGP